MSEPNNSAAAVAASATAAAVAVAASEAVKILDAPFSGVVMTPTKFHFKKDELGNKRPTIDLQLPMLTLEGLGEALADEKVQQLVLSTINDVIYTQARAQVGDEQKPVNTQEELDVSKLNIIAIANLPPAERRGGGISKEVWEAFSKDYLAVMPAATGKSAEACGNAAKLFVGRLQACKTNKPVLKVLRDLLAVYTKTSQSIEEFAEVVEFLDKKAETFLNTDEATLLANL